MSNPTTARCPISYEPLEPGQRYSLRGLKELSPQLQSLADLPLSAAEQRIEARKRAPKMSIQGVQPKLSAILRPAQGRFEITERDGTYILKPPLDTYPQVPENEDLSMRLAATLDIEVPFHGMVYSSDASLTYFIRRFDRQPRGRKLALEDFAQLAGETRETKYNFSMERLAALLDRYCTFPVLEKRKLLERMLFNFLIGNEDMHLKNYSLIRREDKVELSPAYDFLSSTLAMGTAAEEIALPIREKKSRLQHSDLIDYFAYEQLGLNASTVNDILARITTQVPQWERLISISFLSPDMKTKYQELVRSRAERLFAPGDAAKDAP